MNRKGIEFSFGWIFAIIVGAAVIFLAIYASSRLVGTERNIQNAESGSQLGAILGPLETGLESGKFAVMTFPTESRIYNNCFSEGEFGTQKISFESSSGVGNKWIGGGANTSYNNKYLLSQNIVQGKRAYVFSKPFEFPYKVSDLIFIWTDDYCFVNPPADVEEDVTGLNLRGINISSDISDCPMNSKKVCFSPIGISGSKCDIDVALNSKSVSKNGKTTYYEDALIYGAIFANNELYECQVKRLMKRAGKLAEVYSSKIDLVSVTNDGCGTNLQPILLIYKNLTKMESSFGLKEIKPISYSLKQTNDEISACKIF